MRTLNRRIKIGSCAILLAASISPLSAEDLNADTCTPPPPCLSPGLPAEVCFRSYQNFVEKRPDFKTRLCFTMFIGSRTPDTCFLETVTPQLTEDLRKNGIDVHPFQPARPQEGELAGEILIRFLLPEDTKSFVNLAVAREIRGLASTSTASLPATADLIRLGILGPLDNLTTFDAITDQIKVDSNTLTLLGSTSLLAAPESHGIARIDTFPVIDLRNKTTSRVMQSTGAKDRPVFDKGIRGDGQRIAIIDDYIDLNHCFFADKHSPGPNHRKIKFFEGSSSAPPSSHGTYAAGILAGSIANDDHNLRNGQAPAATISFSALDEFALAGPVASTLYHTLLQLRCKGHAEIFSNSWGNKKDDGYSFWSYDVDRFTWEHEDTLVLFAINNAEPGQLQGILNPENARNALAVGASRQEKFQDEKGSGANGPTADFRRKPDLLAPGCAIQSAHVLASCNEAKKSPPCSTSWACPALAGAASLLREHLLKINGTSPSGALLKAALINSAVDMTGIPPVPNLNHVASYPNDIEGWGRVILENVILPTGSARKLVTYDVRNKDGFKPAIPEQTRNYRVKSTKGAFKATLAWTDHPPSPSEVKSPIVNDLDLRVRRLGCQPADPCLYFGNDFNTGVSTRRREDKPAYRDTVNNVEQVLIPSASGDYCVSVVGRKIHSGTQGFALALSGEIVVSVDEKDDSCPAVGSVATQP